MIVNLIEKLVQKQDLTFDESKSAMTLIIWIIDNCPSHEGGNGG